MGRREQGERTSREKWEIRSIKGEQIWEEERGGPGRGERCIGKGGRGQGGGGRRREDGKKQRMGHEMLRETQAREREPERYHIDSDTERHRQGKTQTGGIRKEGQNRGKENDRDFILGFWGRVNQRTSKARISPKTLRIRPPTHRK